MGFSQFDTTQFWDQHVKKLRSIQAEKDSAEAHLESVREKRASPRSRFLNLASYVPKKHERQQ
jgi:hypothetical protein